MRDAVSDLIGADALVDRFEHLKSFDHVLVAVSGGGDSTALLRLIHRWAVQEQIGLAKIEAVTVDHHLRPGSSQEARVVAHHANTLGLCHTTVRWQGDKPVQGLQNAARDARYRLLCEQADKRQGHGVIVTAHTSDDQAETVLMILARGSGPDGLAAIPALSEIGNVTVSRPLLDVPHDALITLLETEQVDWVEDPMNEERSFERVRVRQARQARDAIGLDDVALARTAKRMARARGALEFTVDGAVAELLAGQPSLPFGAVHWTAECHALPEDIAIRLLRRTVHAVGGQERPPELGQIEQVYTQLCDPFYCGGTLHGCRLARSTAGRRGVILFREIGRSPLPELTWSRDGEVLWDRRFLVWCDTCPAEDGVRVVALSANALAQSGDQDLFRLPSKVPRDVLWTLPAVWARDELVSIPSLGWNLPGFQFHAEFLQKRLNRPVARPIDGREMR